MPRIVLIASLIAAGVSCAAAAAAAAVPLSCFVVNADPNEATDSAFATLVDPVELADEHRVAFTLLFTARWTELVLAGPTKVSAIAGFVSRRHEVVAHVSDYAERRLAFARWFDVLMAADAEGVRRATVGTAVRA